MTEVRWLNDREAAAWQAVLSLGQPLFSALGRDLQRESGLSMADYQVLVVLSECDTDVLAYRELAEETGWEKSRLSHHITRMERRGLVRREGCVDDARSANIALTALGRESIETAAPGHVASVRRLLIDVLSDGQMDALIAVGDQTSRAIEESTSLPSARSDHREATVER
ncbi:MAG: MarR family winged helix-turn-helix transcriptional regulator [Nakamurella sp.]